MTELKVYGVTIEIDGETVADVATIGPPNNKVLTMVLAGQIPDEIVVALLKTPLRIPTDGTAASTELDLHDNRGAEVVISPPVTAYKMPQKRGPKP